MDVLVTGDRGYIGAVLVPLLLKNGYRVTGVDTEYYTQSLEKSNPHEQYKKITKDIRDIQQSDVERIDAVIHLAALSNDPIGEIKPELTKDINHLASLRLAKLSKKAGVKRFLFSSSCSVYGISKEGEIVNERSKVSPQTAYAESKINVENGLKTLADDKFCVGLLRNATVYGYSPKFRNDLVVNNFVTCAIALGSIRVMSDGTPWRPLIDVRDLCAIFLEFLTAKESDINGEVINIGFNENNFQVKDLLSMVQKYVPECEVVYTGEHGSDTRSYRVNFDKFAKIFPNYRQKWTLEKSVKNLVGRLKKACYSKIDFTSEKYTRIAVIKKRLKEKTLDNSLHIN